MARIPYPDPQSMQAEIADRLKRLGSLNVTRIMAHSPGLMVAYSKLGTHLLRDGALDAITRELVILRIGVLCESEYEWHQHVSIAKAVGMPQVKIDAMRSGDVSVLDEREAIAVRFAEQTRLDGRVGDEIFALAQAHYSAAELVELSLLAGFYAMTAGCLRNFDVEIEDTPPLGDTMKMSQLV